MKKHVLELHSTKCTKRGGGGGGKWGVRREKKEKRLKKNYDKKKSVGEKKSEGGGIRGVSVLVQMTKVARDHNISIEPILKTLCTFHPSYAKWKGAHPHH